jgi:two-component sensor histidine kinase
MQTAAPKSAIASMEQELIAAGDGLAGNADLLRSVLAGCGDCIKILDLDGRLQFMSEGGKRVMEVEDFGKLKGCPWPDFWTGQGNTDARQAVATAIQGGVGRFKGPANTARGNLRHWDVQVAPIRGDKGQVTHLLSISRDITEEWRAVSELRDAMERQALLAAELQHRIKNTLAMVGAIANQTMRGDDVALARKAFNSRLTTLSRAHDILTQTSWTSAPIRDVIDGALALHPGQGRIDIRGPDLELAPKQALALALASHELATNAVKYGALSVSGGRVDIVWSNATAGTDAGFRFGWTESGGPPVEQPAEDKKGFGSRLIERILANDFAGEVRISYRPTGVVCELNAPTLAPAIAPAREAVS